VQGQAKRPGRALIAIAICFAAPSIVAQRATAPAGHAPATDAAAGLAAGPEFREAYRAAYARRFAVTDAVGEVYRMFHDAIAGPHHAGPAAIGPQLDVALDSALSIMQGRVCQLDPVTVAATAPAATAEALASAARTLGKELPPRTLGAMAGLLLGALPPLDARCICAARTFDAIATSCAPPSR